MWQSWVGAMVHYPVTQYPRASFVRQLYVYCPRVCVVIDINRSPESWWAIYSLYCNFKFLHFRYKNNEINSCLKRYAKGLVAKNWFVFCFEKGGKVDRHVKGSIENWLKLFFQKKCPGLNLANFNGSFFSIFDQFGNWF